MAISSELAYDAVLVPLRDGPAVPAGVISWPIRAEDRGVRIRPEPDGRLHVSPKNVVTREDLAFVKAHHNVVLACVIYINQIAKEPQ